jgi:hypothetical protein
MKLTAKRHKYPLWVTLSYIVPSLFLILLGFALLLSWVGAIFGVLPDEHWGPRPLSDYVALLVVGILTVFSGGLLLTLYTEVIVTDRGIMAKVLIFRWVLIPWEDVMGITVTPLHNDPDLWRFIRVRKLTFFHRFASLCYNTGSDPVLIVSSSMDSYEELMQIIEEHVEQNRIASGEREC